MVKSSVSMSKAAPATATALAPSGTNTGSDASYHEVNKYLSQALMALSIVDRNDILEEIHGVRCLSVKETPELIKRSLQEFQRELDKYEDDKMSENVYRFLVNHRDRDNSFNNNPYDNYETPNCHRNHNINNCNYAFKDDFWLRFLRCELFDVPKAVMRFCNYLCYTHELWGDIALERPVRITDFTKSELKILRQGYIQVLPYRDNNGRRIMTFLFKMEQDFYVMNKIRNFNRSSWSNRLGRQFSSAPSRIVAMHYPTGLNFRDHLLMLKLLVTKVFEGRNAHLRPRFIMAPMGSGLETRNWWKTYGIPIQLFPLTDTGSIKLNYHKQWIRTRRISEEQEFGLPDHNDAFKPQAIGHTIAVANESNPQADIIMGSDAATALATGTLVECPALNDVVFRKGSRTTSVDNPGNRLVCDLIQTFLVERERESEKVRQEELSTQWKRSWEWEGDDASQSAADSDGLSSTPHMAITEPSTPSTPERSRLAAERTSLIFTKATTTLRDKKRSSKAFCEWLLDFIEQECNGRFLDWNTDLSGWFVMRDKIKITYKISVALYNWGKRLNANTIAIKRQKQRSHQPSSLSMASSNTGSGDDSSFANDIGDGGNTVDDHIYSRSINSLENNTIQLIDRRILPSEQQESSRIPSSSLKDSTSAFTTPNTTDKKRQRKA